MTEWSTEKLAHKPENIQDLGANRIMERRNIKEVHHEATDEQEAYTEWTCECREMSKDEYNTLKAIEGINTDKAIEEYTLQLMQEGVI